MLDEDFKLFDVLDFNLNDCSVDIFTTTEGNNELKTVASIKSQIYSNKTLIPIYNDDNNAGDILSRYDPVAISEIGVDDSSEDYENFANDSCGQLTFFTKNSKNYPQILVNAFNSADTSFLSSVYHSAFFKNCIYCRKFPQQKYILEGYQNILDSSLFMLETYPDSVCSLNELVIANPNQYTTVIDYKIRFVCTISKHSMHYQKINEITAGYNPDKDNVVRRNRTLRAFEALRNGDCNAQLFIKIKLRIYIDNNSNKIIKLEEIPRISSCQIIVIDSIDESK